MKKKNAQEAAEKAAFVRRPSYENYRPPEYQLYPALSRAVMLPQLDAHLEALFAGEVDDANGDMLDGIIFAPLREAMPELARQRYNHADVLRRIIARRVSDRADFENLLELRRQELRELEQANAETRRMTRQSIGKE